ncbi:MAG: FAD:protein FMN transferase [Candidatus Latescibacteria bacterium]|jgi:FAD:protein FMN transferase|nr:FAD:protein FMN transferase [Candidatus Latescibacterota bacterium]
MRKNIALVAGIVSIMIILLWRFIWYDPYPVQSQTRFLMDTFCTIQVPGNINVLPAIELAFERIEEIDVKFNAINPESPVYAFNNNNKPIEDEEIVALVKTALQVSKKSGGKFDITIFPLIKLWGFFSDSPKLPHREKIEEVLKTVGYEYIAVENDKIIKKKEGIKIDLGSIAKGYAIGEAKIVLEQAGIKSALIDAGGDIYSLGSNNGKPWIIGIRNPRGEGVVGALELSDVAVITSGDYERVFEEGGVKYHHILDPETGFPAKGSASVTVISPDPAQADAWSTAFFVLGKEKTQDILNGLESIELLMITDKGEKIYSSGMKIEMKVIENK